MGFIGGSLGYRLLKRINPGGARDNCSGDGYAGRSKIEVLFDKSVWSDVQGKTVVDFGCGTGTEAIEIARRGARRVIGLDIRESVLAAGREAAMSAGVSDRCVFATRTDEKADVIFSLDAFEHFDDPAHILGVMRDLVKDDGCALVVFGPTWYHPFGGHLFSVFPWAHLLFTEHALIRWRADFKNDGATKLSEVEGGLNQMTIRRFETLVARSDWMFKSLECVPIRQARQLHLPANALTREFLTSVVRCSLRPRGTMLQQGNG